MRNKKLFMAATVFGSIMTLSGSLWGESGCGIAEAMSIAPTNIDRDIYTHQITTTVDATYSGAFPDIALDNNKYVLHWDEYAQKYNVGQYYIDENYQKDLSLLSIREGFPAMKHQIFEDECFPDRGYCIADANISYKLELDQNMMDAQTAAAAATAYVKENNLSGFSNKDYQAAKSTKEFQNRAAEAELEILGADAIKINEAKYNAIAAANKTMYAEVNRARRDATREINFAKNEVREYVDEVALSKANTDLDNITDNGKQVIRKTVAGDIAAAERNSREYTDYKTKELSDDISKVGAQSAAMANLRTTGIENKNSVSFAVAMGGYKNQTAAAIGAFYKPSEKSLLSLSGSVGGGDNMYGIGFSQTFGKSNPKESSYEKEIEDLRQKNEELTKEVSFIKKAYIEIKEQLVSLLK